MGRIIRGQRKGAGSIFTSNTSKRKGEAKHRQAVRGTARHGARFHRGIGFRTRSGGFSAPADVSPWSPKFVTSLVIVEKCLARA
jgi:hypothetical protein